MKKPEISIVMPVYNAASFLAEAIDSILNQFFENFELIIVDDGSSDDSLKISQSYTDERIQLIQNKHNYIESLNKGVSAAKGKYIARMDSDDIMMPHRLQRQFEFMEANPAIDICGGWMDSFGNASGIVKTRLEHPDIAKNMLFASQMCHPTIILRREILDKFPLENGICRLYNPDFIYAEDYKLWIDMIAKGFKFANIPEVILKYRHSDHQVTVTKQAQMTGRTLEIQIEFAEYLMQEIVKKDKGFNEFFDNLIDLCNDQKMTFANLKQIVAMAYQNSNL